MISEKDLENAVGNARINQLDVATVLMEDYKVPKEEIGRALAQFYNAPFADLDGRKMPADLKERLTVEFLKKNVCAPLEKREGTLVVAVEDPYDLTRLDAIKAMNLAPRHDFVVTLQEGHQRLHQPQLRRDHAIGRGGRPRAHHHRAGIGRGGRGRGRSQRSARGGRDGQRGREALQPDHHRRLQPRGVRHPHRALREDTLRPRCGCASTATATSTSRSRPPTATPWCSASRSCPSWTSRRSASPRTARSASRAPWGPSSCAWPPSRPRAATRTS